MMMHRAHSVAFAEVQPTDADGMPVASASATCRIAPLEGQPAVTPALVVFSI